MVKVNIVAKTLPCLAYQNEYGELWTGPYDSTMHNVVDREYSQGLFANESLLILEPYCVDALDYNLETCKKFKHVFTWTPAYFSARGWTENIVKINVPSTSDPFDANSLYKNNTPWEKRKNEIVVIANNKHSTHYSQTYTLRVEFSDRLHLTKYFKIAWYGYDRLHKNYYKGPATSKYDVLKNSKFALCIENCYDQILSQNYFTEKFPEVITSGAVPLYLGCYNIDEFGLDPKSYVDLRYFVGKHGNSHGLRKKSLIDVMLGFDYEAFKVGMKKNVSILNKVTSYSTMYDTILKTVVGHV